MRILDFILQCSKVALFPYSAFDAELLVGLNVFPPGTSASKVFPFHTRVKHVHVSDFTHVPSTLSLIVGLCADVITELARNGLTVPRASTVASSGKRLQDNWTLHPAQQILPIRCGGAGGRHIGQLGATPKWKGATAPILPPHAPRNAIVAPGTNQNAQAQKNPLLCGFLG